MREYKKGEFSIDRKNNSINQTMASIKNVQKIAPQILYSMSMKKDSYQNLFLIFQDLKNSELNKKTIDIIFKLNYFKEYVANQDMLDFSSLLKTNATYEEIYKAFNWICSRANIDINEYIKNTEKSTEQMIK